MKRKHHRWLMVCLFTLLVARGQAQVYETEQLLLDVQKLGQLKQILQDLKDGYQVLDKGYSAIRDIARGNFNLHKAFLDGLLVASPTVKSYQRVADIASLQASLVQKYQRAWSRFRRDGFLRPEELALLGQVYSGLLAGSLQDLSDLVGIVTDGTMRASDAERLQQMDAIYERMLGKVVFLDRVNNTTALLSLQRQGDAGDAAVLKQLYGIIP